MSSHTHHPCGSTRNVGLLPLFKTLSPGTMIRTVTDSGDVIAGTFIRLVGDPYIEISESGSTSPFTPGGVVFVDAAKIESISFISR